MMGEAWERDWTYGSSSAKTVCLVLVLMLAARRRGGVQCIYCLLRIHQHTIRNAMQVNLPNDAPIWMDLTG